LEKKKSILIILILFPVLFLSYNKLCKSFSSMCFNRSSNESQLTESFSQMHIKNSKCFDNEIFSIKEIGYKTRQCNTSCNIPLNWACKLFNSFKEINDKLDFDQLKLSIVNFENCKKCNQYKTNGCQIIEFCDNKLKLLQNLSPHYQKIRTILRRIYEIRSLNLWLCRFDEIIKNGDLLDFKSLIQSTPQMVNIKFVLKCFLFNYFNVFIKKILNRPENNISETDIYKNFQDCIESFNKDLSSKSDVIECECCHQMIPKKLTCVINSISIKSLNNISVLQKLINIEKKKLPIRICRNYCYNSLKNNEIPCFSILNNMKLSDLPFEISGLNNYEIMLIQLAKYFHTIFRLQTVTKIKNKTQIYGFKGIFINVYYFCEKFYYYLRFLFSLKGIAVYLPLPEQETLDYVNSTLPSKKNYHIIVDSLPSKIKQTVWRTLINLEKVIVALDWLKKNNKYYKNIIISHLSNFPVDNLFIEENESSNFDKKINCEQNEPMLEHKVSCDIQHHYSIAELSKTVPLNSNLEIYDQKRINNEPLNIKNPDLDHLCFPNIFPYGKYGMYDSREISVSPLMYCKWIFRQRNPIARRNIPYLFSLCYNKDIRALDSGIFASLRTSKMKTDLTAASLLKKLKNKDQTLEAHLSTMFTSVRGTRQYWNRLLGDLELMDQYYGPATFFITLSSAEYYWDDHADYMRIMNIDLDHKNMSIDELNVLDPISVSTHFQNRFSSFLKTVILNPKGPFGKVAHYFYRLEYQARGAPHIHMKIWLNNAPIFGINSNDEIIAFIEKHITCELPDESQNPILFELVNKFQFHRCRSHCKRIQFYKGKCFVGCKHGFPRSVNQKTSLNTLEATVKSRRRGRNPIKLYNLKRSIEEEYINDYNPLCLLVWKANMDIQYIPEHSMILNRYITSYVTKAEKNATQELWNACNNNKSLHSCLKSFALQSFKNKEVGAYEAADKLMGFPLYGRSCKIQWLGVGQASDRKRKLKDIYEIEKLDDESTNLFCSNMIDTYYPNRPLSLETKCLYEIVSNYDYKKKECIDNQKHNECVTLQNNCGFLHKRNDICLIKTPQYKSSNESTKENFYHQLLMLFKPWRNENELIANFHSYEDAFIKFNENEQNNNIFNEYKKRIKKIEVTIKYLETLTNQIQNEEEKTEQPVESEQEIFFEVPYHKLNQENLNTKISQLNLEQRQVFEQIADRLKHQEQHKNSECKCGSEIKPLRLFCSGSAGMIELKRINHFEIIIYYYF